MYINDLPVVYSINHLILKQSEITAYKVNKFSWGLFCHEITYLSVHLVQTHSVLDIFGEILKWAICNKF